MGFGFLQTGVSVLLEVICSRKNEDIYIYVYKCRRKLQRSLGTGNQCSPFLMKSDVLWGCEVSPGVRCREEACKRPERTQGTERCEVALSRDTGLRSWAAHPLPLDAPKAGGQASTHHPRFASVPYRTAAESSRRKAVLSQRGRDQAGP